MDAIMKMLNVPMPSLSVTPPAVAPINWSPEVTLPRAMSQAGAWFSDGAATTAPHTSPSDVHWLFPEDQALMRASMASRPVIPPTADLRTPHFCVSLLPSDAEAGLHLKQASLFGLFS
jgi:hypothetical protein